MRRAICLLAAAGAVAAGGCGSDETASSPAALAPAGTFVYGEADLAPEGEQRSAIDDLLAKFPGSGGAGERLARLFERALSKSETGLSYRRDIEPWLGDRAAFFAAGPFRNGQLQDGAALVQTDDEAATEEAIQKAGRSAKKSSYEGRDYWTIEPAKSARLYEDGHPGIAAGVVDGHLVAGTERAFKQAVDVAEGDEALAGADRFEAATDGIEDERLGYFYFDGRAFLRGLGDQVPGTLLEPYRKLFGEPQVATFDADADGLEATATVNRDAAAALGPFFGSSPGLLPELPADSWAAFGQPDLGKLLGGYVDLFAGAIGGRDALAKLLRNQTGLDLDRDVLGWMGDFGFYVRGESLSRLSGALVVETDDAAASRRALGALEKALRGANEIRVLPLGAPGGGDGFSVETSGAPEPFHVVQRAGKVVFAYGDAGVEGAFDARETLGDAAEFRQARSSLGDGFDASFYLAVAPIFRLVESAVSDPGVAEAKPYVEPLEAIVAGTKEDGDKLRSRSRLTVR